MLLLYLSIAFYTDILRDHYIIENRPLSLFNQTAAESPVYFDIQANSRDFIVGLQTHIKEGDFSFHIRPYLSNKKQYPYSRKWKAFYADAATSFITYKGTFFLGRRMFYLSPALSPLFLGDIPLDVFGFNAQYKGFHYIYFVSILPSYSDTSGTSNRVFVAKRLNYTRHRISISFSELSIHSFTYILPDIAYLNPVYSTYIYQWNREIEENSIWVIQSEYFLKHDIRMWSTLLVDDFQYGARDSLKDHIGWNVGTDVVKSHFILHLSTKGATRWVFNNKIPSVRFVVDSFNLGDKNIPDFMETSLLLDYVNNPFFVRAGFKYLEKGGSSVYDQWPHNSYGSSYVKFPSCNFLCNPVGKNLYPELDVFYKIGGLFLGAGYSEGVFKLGMMYLWR